MCMETAGWIVTRANKRRPVVHRIKRCALACDSDDDHWRWELTSDIKSLAFADTSTMKENIMSRVSVALRVVVMELEGIRV